MASFSISPTVDLQEIDKSRTSIAFSTSIGGTVIPASWGPVNKITYVDSDNAIVKTFGKPTNLNAAYFLSAASFLNYSRDLRLIRCAQDDYLNAVAYIDPDVSPEQEFAIDNEDAYSTMTFASYDNIAFAARYPGRPGNSLKVSYCLAGGSFEEFRKWEYSEQFPEVPSTSDYASDRGSSNDEMHLVVIDEKGEFSGIPGAVLEKYAFLSLASDAKDAAGKTAYYKDVITNSSKYIYCITPDTLLSDSNAGGIAAENPVFFDNTTLPLVSYKSYTLVNGADSATIPTETQLKNSFDIFKTPDADTISLIFSGPIQYTGDIGDSSTYADYIVNIAKTKGFSLALVSPPVELSVNKSDTSDVVTFLAQLESSSHGACDTTAVQVYDRYNDKYVWIPACGHVAGLCAYTDQVADPWWSPAGFNRGVLKNVTRVAYSPSKAERDTLYAQQGNPIVNFAGQGIILYGDKTLLNRPSAFDRINVRRLFNVVEKMIAETSRYMLFDINDEQTRSAFVLTVDPILRGVQGRRGLYSYSIVCDESNNDADSIDNNELYADIFLQPSKSINFIKLSFTATRTDGTLTEII